MTTTMTLSYSLSSSETNSSLKTNHAEITNELGTEKNPQSTTFAISLIQECTAIKKGLLWEQQQNRFFFNRWKERFFILTTDYLTCFKKGSKKVGMSEMGSFVYKINLNEIKNLTWVDKKKNGVIGVQLANTAIFLWNSTDSLLDEWMAVMQESTIRTKGRREALRKSATLLPTMISSSPSHFSSTEFNLIERNNSPNLVMNRSNTPSENGLIGDMPPPPPPPRRYLRCTTSDLDKVSSSLEDRKLMTTGPSRVETKKMMINGTSSGPSMSHTFHKLGPDYGMRKLSTASSVSSNVSQSLRCKSSYALQLSPLMIANSPTLIHQQQQRRLTAKRLSAVHQDFSTNQSKQSQVRPQSQTLFQSADSEFSFIPSKSTTFRNLSSTPPKNSAYYPNGSITRSSISSSALMVLNASRRAVSGLEGERRGVNTPPPPPPPPPVPPHRTHLHHF